MRRAYLEEDIGCGEKKGGLEEGKMVYWECNRLCRGFGQFAQEEVIAGSFIVVP